MKKETATHVHPLVDEIRDLLLDPTLPGHTEKELKAAALKMVSRRHKVALAKVETLWHARFGTANSKQLQEKAAAVAKTIPARPRHKDNGPVKAHANGQADPELTANLDAVITNIFNRPESYRTLSGCNPIVHAAREGAVVHYKVRLASGKIRPRHCSAAAFLANITSGSHH